MISLVSIKETEKIREIFKEKKIEYDDYSGCLLACENDNILGLSLYRLDNEKIVVFHIEPTEDIALADGILRSTLHIAAERSIMNAFYSDSISIDFLKKINFIKNESEKSLDIDKLFKSCCDCK